MSKTKWYTKPIYVLVALVLAMSLLLVAAPAALAWQEGPGTDWWYIDASYGDWKYSVPFVIEIDGDSADFQVFTVGTQVTITSDIRAYAASCAGAQGTPHNEAITEGYLEVDGASGFDSVGNSGYHYNSPSCAEVSTIETLSISYTVTTPGIHTIKASSKAEVRQYGNDVAEDYVDASINFVVYDPEGGEGHVTGGGWIDSPEGAFKDEPSLTGKASFGFVSKYKKGASTPDGQTEFQFKAGGLNFHSSSYDWLVVTEGGTNALFKGTGTIGGVGEYKFMLWAGDDVTDTFRIRIWGVSVGVVYDNGVEQPIGGGSIIVHKGKN